MCCCNHSYCLTCISTWLNEKGAKTCPLCRLKVSYSTILTIKIKTQIETSHSHLPNSEKELDALLHDEIDLRGKVFMEMEIYTACQDHAAARQCETYLRQLDIWTMECVQRKLTILRARPQDVWRDLQIWIDKEECRQITGRDPDKARMIAGGFEDIVEDTAG